MAPAQADAGPVLDRSGDLPLHAQMAAQLRGAISTAARRPAPPCPARRRYVSATAWLAAWCGRRWPRWRPRA